MAKSSHIHNFQSRTLVLFVLLFLCLSKAYAFNGKDPDLSLFNHDKYSLEPYIEILEDPTNQITIDDILANEDDIGFQKNNREHINYSFTSSSIWIRFDVDYPVHSSNKLPDRTWYLDIDRASLDTCEFYIVSEDNSFEMLKADTSIRQEERLINAPTSVFPFDLQLSDRKRIYVKMETINAFYFHINLWRPEAFIKHSTQLQLSYGFFYGGMGIVIIYNLFHFFATRDKNYLFYISYMASITLLEFIELGHGIQISGPLQDFLHKKYIPAIGWFCWASILLFTMTYLETEKNHPFFHFVLKRMLTILIFNIIIDPFVSYQTSVFAVVFFSAMCLTLIPYLGIYTWMNGNPNGEYFTYANVCAISGIIIYCLITMDVLPASKSLTSLFSFGILAEALLFSLAIGNRINRAQQEALNSNQLALENLTRYQSLFENAKEGMYQVDLEGRLVQSNNSLANILGFPDSKSLITSAHQISENFFRASGFDFSNRELIENHRAEFSFANQNNETKWVNHSSNLIVDSDNQPIGYEGIVIDITDRKEREAVQKATIEESYRKELAAKESLETTNFLANMSYRIRASLNSILGYAEIQNLGTVSEKKKHDTAVKGLNTSNKLLGLINKILDYSKLEAKKLDVEAINCNLGTIFHEVIESTNTTKLTEYHFPLPARVTTDPIRLAQCLSEIIDYALENSSNHKISTDVFFNSESSCLEFSVVFSTLNALSAQECLVSFKQRSAWISTPSEDSGLGLTLANDLSKLLGGSLLIETLNQNQTSLALTMPLKVVDGSNFYQNHKDLKQDIKNILNQSASKNTQYKGTILVAEDNIVNQKLIQKLLEKLGATVIMANNGKEAVEIAKAEHVDLIFMDLNMPVMDGFAAADTLLSLNHAAPIYALTADNSNDIIEKCLSLGFKGHLDKPIKKQIVVDVLNQYQHRAKDNS